MNKLIHGDNLAVMEKIQDESVDLIIADGPFYSQANYGAFNDKWESLDRYLNFMSVRLDQMRCLLKETGSLYLHCDPHASHYLKVKLDEIFGYDNFRAEIIWWYHWGIHTPNNWSKKHDVLLYYSKNHKSVFFDGNRIRVPYTGKPNSMTQDPKYNKSFNPNGKLPEDVIEMQVINGMSKERTGYPTQKPVELYRRIIKASSNKGDLILDPFCGSGTSIDAAESLGRKWIGIDRNEEAIKITEERMKNNYGLLINKYEVINNE